MVRLTYTASSSKRLAKIRVPRSGPHAKRLPFCERLRSSRLPSGCPIDPPLGRTAPLHNIMGRLVERGVRFIQLYSGGGPVSVQWDAHKDLVGNHEKMCRMTDLPIAGLLLDLKQRGLLDSTLVIWGAEFGRLPMSQDGDGRDHNPHGFTMWFAGGGVKPGTIVGETDEMGLRGVGSRYPMRDFHATILHLMGLDQNRLWFLHNGRNEKLTDFGGNVIREMLA